MSAKYLSEKKPNSTCVQECVVEAPRNLRLPGYLAMIDFSIFLTVLFLFFFFRSCFHCQWVRLLGKEFYHSTLLSLMHCLLA